MRFRSKASFAANQAEGPLWLECRHSIHVRHRDNTCRCQSHPTPTLGLVSIFSATVHELLKIREVRVGQRS